jgi:HAD superfamily hydrolase (TIGR01509 family)
MSKLTHALGLTKLLEHFEGRIFSAYEVGSWKPDPGLFLHAAQTLSVHPSRCIVSEACDDLFHRMSDLPALLRME